MAATAFTDRCNQKENACIKEESIYALRVVDQALKEGYTRVVDADLQSYFDMIPKEALLALVKEKIRDARVVKLVKSFLDQDILEGMNRWTLVAGTPQGSVISPLMSNLHLHGLDRLMSEGGHRYVRFADDFVTLCRTRQEAEAVFAKIRAWVEQNGLRLHPDKTRLGNCRIKGEGFEFLGYRFEAGRRWVRSKSRKTLRDKIREKTGRTRSGRLETIIRELNPILKGWFGYFQHAHRTPFSRRGRFYSAATEGYPAKTGETPRLWSYRTRSRSLAKCLLR